MKNRITAFAIFALMLLILTPVSVLPVMAQIPNPDTYIIESIGEPMNADPVFQYDVASLELLMNIYEPLIFFNGSSVTEFIGLAAESWVAEIIDVTDPKTGLNYKQRWNFTIRQGIHFHHIDGTWPGEGNELTIEDVEYSFERNMVVDAATGGECLIYDPLLHCYTANMTDELWGRKIDFAVQSDPATRTVSFYLLSPFEPFLQVVAQMYGAIFCKEWMVDRTLHPHTWDGTWADWDQPNSAANNYTAWHAYHDPPTSPIEEVDSGSPGSHLDYCLGTGPYMLKYWDKGKGGEYCLIKNPNYWRGWEGKHVDTFISKYIEAWETRRADFLTGAADTVNVPRMYLSQVEGQPGIRCVKDLPQLYCLAEFFNGGIASESTYCGTMPPNGTFSSEGFPQNGFQDIKLRKAFRALFAYDQWLEAAYLGEAVQPATCIVPGLAYHDPDVPKPTYDRDLAVKLLKEAWGGSEAAPGPVWTNGFTMGFVYNEGNEMRKLAAEMLRDEFESLNSEFGTSFTGVVTAVPWGGYNVLWRTRVLPFYSVAWGADFPDAHNFAVPFMDSVGGAFARFQSFPNETINTWIRQGIDTIVPSERQGNYTALQWAYVDNCYSFALAQVTGRRWEREWVQGWYFHPLMFGEEYVYYRWKEWYTPPPSPPSVSASFLYGTSIPISGSFIDPTAEEPAVDFLVFIQQSLDEVTWTNIGAAITDENGFINASFTPTLGTAYYRLNFTGYLVPAEVPIVLDAKYCEWLIENASLPLVLLSQIGTSMEVETKTLEDILTETLTPMATKNDTDALSSEISDLHGSIDSLTTLLYASIIIAIIAIIIAIVPVIKKRS